MNWFEMEEFKGIDLCDSFVLSWSQKEGLLTFKLEASIWPSSKYYSTPKDNEYTCYKNANLIFSNAKMIEGLKSIDSANKMTDANNSIDYGNIDTLVKTESGFELTGEFGFVRIHGGELKFKIL